MDFLQRGAIIQQCNPAVKANYNSYSRLSPHHLNAGYIMGPPNRPFLSSMRSANLGAIFLEESLSGKERLRERVYPQIILPFMSSNTHKNQIQSLSSLSLSQNLRDLRDSQGFPNPLRKSSFDIVNMLADSSLAYFNRGKLEKSLDLLNSSIQIGRTLPHHLNNLLQYTEEDRMKIERAGLKVSEFDEVDSQSQQPSPDNQIPDQVKLEAYSDSEDSENYKVNQYLPQDLALLLQEKEIPLEYVRGLLLVRDQKEIKSIRRIKVQRYLQKRRNKTWNKKICYNCRQKVAEERLRIKGKFIKKRRAMQILGVTTPINLVEVKRMLEELLKDKTSKEIEMILKKQDEDQ